MITHLVSTTKFVKIVDDYYNKEDVEIPDWIFTDEDLESLKMNLIRLYVELILQKPTVDMFVGDRALFKGYTKENLWSIPYISATNGVITSINYNTIEEMMLQGVELELTGLGLKKLGLC